MHSSLLRGVTGREIGWVLLVIYVDQPSQGGNVVDVSCQNQLVAAESVHGQPGSFPIDVLGCGITPFVFLLKLFQQGRPSPLHSEGSLVLVCEGSSGQMQEHLCVGHHCGCPNWDCL